MLYIGDLLFKQKEKSISDFTKQVVCEHSISHEKYWNVSKDYLKKNNLKIIPFVENIFDDEEEQLIFDNYFKNTDAVFSLLGNNEVLYLKDYFNVFPSDIYLSLHFLYFILFDKKITIFNDNDYYHFWIAKEEDLKNIFKEKYKLFFNNFYKFYEELIEERKNNIQNNPYDGIIKIYDEYKDFFLKND